MVVLVAYVADANDFHDDENVAARYKIKRLEKPSTSCIAEAFKT